ncbi:MAG TPA: hypothetical protein PLP91_02445, partial [Plasticicumulans sp.]|nr:hypothetical protein [Plasticicumulans sp.]
MMFSSAPHGRHTELPGSERPLSHNLRALAPYLWEFRGRARVHTHSAVMCWAACRRLAKIAQRLDLPARAEHWYAEADRLRAAIVEQAWNPRLDSFVAGFGGEDIDASLLLL